MKTRASNLSKFNDRRGFILLALLLILLITGSAFVLAGLNNRGSIYLDQQAELHRQLAEAKANLLAYVANSNTFNNEAIGPGFFPCPDADKDGVADSTCDPVDLPMTGCSPYNDTDGPKPLVGRLPEYVVNAVGDRFTLNNHYANIDQQFWYVVAPRYVYTSPSNTMPIALRRSQYRTSTAITPSTDTPIAPACMRMYEDSNSGYIAFIIAPGEALDTQDRAAGSQTLYSNYLDGQNGASNYHYYTNYESNPSAFNDQIIGITLNEYMKAVGTKVAVKIKKVLDSKFAANGNQYPASLGTQFDDQEVWLQSHNAGSTYNGEDWATDTNYVWSITTPAQAIISFSGCPSITYTLIYSPPSITPHGVSCS